MAELKKLDYYEGNEVCSFCGSSKSEVEHMFGNGTSKFICGDCVAASKEIMCQDENSNS